MRRHKSGHGSAASAQARANAHKPQSIGRAFEASRPERPSPLASSMIRDMPLDLVERIRSFPLFAKAPDTFLTTLGTHLRPQLYSAQETILSEGEEAKAMYWLVRGAVTVQSRDGESVYAELKPGSFFGEIGILMGIPRTASIVARYKTLVMRLNKDDLNQILPSFPDVERQIRDEAAERLQILERKKKEKHLTAPPQALKIGTRGGKRHHDYLDDDTDMADSDSPHSSKKRKSPSPSLIDAAASSALSSGSLHIRQLLKGLPLFSQLPDEVLHFIGLNVQPQSFPPFTQIVQEGTLGREIFFITDGEVEVYKEDSKGVPHIRARLKFGQYFGEVTSLALAPKRTANVRSVTSVECLVINSQVLEELWQRAGPSLRQQLEQTARQRLQNTNELDVTMVDATGASPAMDKLDINEKGRTARNEKKTKRPPSISFEPFDPDPYPTQERSQRRGPSRRGSLQLQTAPLESSPLADADSYRPKSPSMSSSSSAMRSAPASPTMSLHPRRPRMIQRTASQLGKGRLPDKLLMVVFQQLDIYHLMRLRQISWHWHRLLTQSNDILEVLDLRPYNRQVTDAALVNFICPFVGPRPRIINLSSCFHITDDGFNALTTQCGANVEVWKMKSVWDISASAVISMANRARNLEEIDFSNCRKVSDHLLGRVIGWIHRSSTSGSAAGPPMVPDGTIIGCPSLSRLTLSYCKHISDISMAHLARHAASRIEMIDFTRCTTITDMGFRHWSESAFPRLRKLVLADCTYLSDNAIVYLTHAAKALRELDLSFCCALSDTALEVLSLGCPLLTHLNLAFCGSAVSDNSMRALGLHLHALQYVSVRGCVRVTGVGVEAIVSGCRNLRSFDVSQCKNLDPWLAGGGVSKVNLDRRPRVRFETVADGTWRVDLS